MEEVKVNNKEVEEKMQKLSEDVTVKVVWDWEHLPTIAGKVVAIKNVKTKYGMRKVIELEPLNSDAVNPKRWVVYLTTVLLHKCAGVEVGDVIKIYFIGRVDTKVKNGRIERLGKSYYDFSVSYIEKKLKK